MVISIYTCINILRRTLTDENFEDLDAQIFAKLFHVFIQRLRTPDSITLFYIEIIRHVKDNRNTRKNFVMQL